MFIETNKTENVVIILTPDIASKDELHSLHAQMEKLITFHNATLKNESLFADVERIMKWIENCENGSTNAERKLYTEGLDMLKNVHDRLHLALEEQQHMKEESPTVATTTHSREKERYAKASGRAGEALSTLSDFK